MSDKYGSEWEALIASVKTHGVEALENLYRAHRVDFIAFAKKIGGSHLAEDIYQDSIVVLYENIIHEKIGSFKSTVKTYLFSIGKYKLLQQLKQVVNHGDEALASEEISYEDVELFNAEQKHRLKKAMEALGEVCKKILIMSYYQGLDNAEILVQMGQKNDQTLRATKSRCLRKLREYVLNNR